MSTITVETPPLSDSGAFAFRREFLHRLRVAIGAAQIRGEIDAGTCVELLRALPPPQTADERGT
jgi:hypothetical protein